MINLKIKVKNGGKEKDLGQINIEDDKLSKLINNFIIDLQSRINTFLIEESVMRDELNVDQSKFPSTTEFVTTPNWSFQISSFWKNNKRLKEFNIIINED